MMNGIMGRASDLLLMEELNLISARFTMRYSQQHQAPAHPCLAGKRSNTIIAGHFWLFYQMV
jgi:hypothetical protein